jgi:hypothetical protein
MTGVLAVADCAHLRASDPTVSAFVNASAGYVKITLLTDRLLLLVMSGAALRKIVT